MVTAVKAADDLLATTGSLTVDTDTGVMTYNDGGGDVLFSGTVANYTVTWTFGDLTIGSGLTTFTISGTNAIKIVADGSGGLGTGNIIIEQNMNLSGKVGGNDNGPGGARTLGGGAGGDDGAVRDGESAAYDAYTRGGYGAGISGSGGSGGGFGGSGGDNLNNVVPGGNWYGRLDLADLGISGGAVAGSGGGSGSRGGAGSGAGALQLIARNHLTIASGVAITANGGQGRATGSNATRKRRSGGGGAGGAIRLVADSDNDGSGTLTWSGATIEAKGGVSDNTNVTAEEGGDGGGGRVVLSAATLVAGTDPDVAGGDHSGGGGAPGEEGSILVDESGKSLQLSGNGVAANAYPLYSNLVVSAKSTFAPGDTNVVGGAVTISNSLAATAVIGGTLAMDIDSTGTGSADYLVVSNALDITNATLSINEIIGSDDSEYVLIEYGSLVGSGFFAATNLPTGYALNYAYDGNKIAIELAAAFPDIATPDSVDCGLVRISTGFARNIAVTNTGGLDLNLSGVSLSGTDADQFTVNSYPATVSGGGVGNIVVTYHPDEADTHTATLVVTSDDPDESPTNVVLTGEGVYTDLALLTTDPLVIGPIKAFQTQNGNVVVSNSGPIDVEITNLTLGAPNADRFSLVSTPGLVAVGATSNIVVTFDPAGAVGDFSTLLTIESDDPDSPTNITIQASSVNSAPDVGSEIAVLAGIDQPFTHTLTATDANGDGITFAKASGPAWLSVAGDGTLTGTPPAGTTLGGTVLTYEATDDGTPSLTTTGRLTISVGNYVFAADFDASPTGLVDADQDLWDGTQVGTMGFDPAAGTHGGEIVTNAAGTDKALLVDTDVSGVDIGLVITGTLSRVVQFTEVNEVITFEWLWRRSRSGTGKNNQFFAYDEDGNGVFTVSWWGGNNEIHYNTRDNTDRTVTTYNPGNYNGTDLWNPDLGVMRVRVTLAQGWEGVQIDFDNDRTWDAQRVYHNAYTQSSVASILLKLQGSGTPQGFWVDTIKVHELPKPAVVSSGPATLFQADFNACVPGVAYEYSLQLGTARGGWLATPGVTEVAGDTIADTTGSNVAYRQDTGYSSGGSTSLRALFLREAYNGTTSRELTCEWMWNRSRSGADKHAHVALMDANGTMAYQIRWHMNSDRVLWNNINGTGIWMGTTYDTVNSPLNPWDPTLSIRCLLELDPSGAYLSVDSNLDDDFSDPGELSREPIGPRTDPALIDSITQMAFFTSGNLDRGCWVDDLTVTSDLSAYQAGTLFIFR